MLGLNALSIDGDSRYNNHLEKCNAIIESLTKYHLDKKNDLKLRTKNLLSEIKKADKKEWDFKSVEEVSIKSSALNSMAEIVKRNYKEFDHMDNMKELAILADQYTPIFIFYTKLYNLNYKQFMSIKKKYELITSVTLFKDLYPDASTQLFVEAVKDESDWIRIETKDTMRHFKSFVKKVETKAGKILDTRYLRVNEKGNLDGYLICEKGHLDIETIGAGGHTIQKFHFRTLMKLK